MRAFNTLRREGIHTLGDLCARSEADLRGIENLGPQSIKDISRKLADRGLALAPATAGVAGPAGAGPAEAGGAAAPGTGPAMAAGAPPQAARPPSEEAIDLLSVAGFPVLKRALPPAGALAALVLVYLRLRRRRRRRRAAGR